MKQTIPPPLGDRDVLGALALFHGGDIGDLGEEDDPGEAIVTLLHPTDDEKLLLLLLLFKLSSLGDLSTVMSTKGPFALKCTVEPF